MSGKVIFTTGSFSGSMGIDSTGNIEINTFQNQKKIIFDGIKAYSGSVEQDIDKSTGKVIKEKHRDIAKGTEIMRSGSATDNQIMMQQNSTGAYITVSGSTPGFNILSTSPTPDLVRLMRADKDSFIGNVGWSQGIAQSNYGGVEQDDWYYSRYHLGASDNSNILILKYDTGNVEIPN